MTIETTPEFEVLVRDVCAVDRFGSEREVVEAALYLLQQGELSRRDLLEGIAELDRGERLAAELVFSELREKAARLDREAKL